MATAKREPRILFLDDFERRAKKFMWSHNNVTWVKTAPQAIQQLSIGYWDYVYLDHDLEDSIYAAFGHHGDGMDVVNWVKKNKPKHLSKTVFFVHSMNNNHGPEMVGKLRDSGYKAYYRPYHGSFYDLEAELDNPVDAAQDPNLFYMPGQVVLKLDQWTSDTEIDVVAKLIKKLVAEKKKKPVTKYTDYSHFMG